LGNNFYGDIDCEKKNIVDFLFLSIGIFLRNFSTYYPVGHPTLDIVEENVWWTHPRDIPLSAHMLKVFIVPPRHVDVAALPMKYHKDSRLLFSLCR
jgi:hypothetical protein